VLGFKDAFRLITEAKIQKQQEREYLDNKFIIRNNDNNDDYNGDTPVLGSVNDQIITNKKRNPNAKQLRDDWNKMATAAIKDINESYVKARAQAAKELVNKPETKQPKDSMIYQTSD